MHTRTPRSECSGLGNFSSVTSCHYCARAARSARAAFDLEEFCRAYNPAERVTTPPSLVERLSLAEKVDKLFELFGELRRSLQPAPGGAGSMLPRSPAAVLPGPAVAARPSTPDADLLGLGGMPIPWTLPPAAVCHLRCSSFEVPRAKVKGECYPPQAHQLAAHRPFRNLGSDEGRWGSPMSFALHVGELDCVRFDAPPAVLMALYGGRLGSRGLTVMHLRPQSEMEQLQRGSSNANFGADFGASATLPATDVRCPTYEDLLAAVGGLISFGALWYDHARHLLSRLKRFVLANMERDSNTPERVMLTLMYVNQFLGRALAHLLVDSPHWWREFCDAVRAVDYHSPDWQAALNGLALRMATSTAPSQPTSASSAAARTRDAHSDHARAPPQPDTAGPR
ncbi:hypothetical protein PF003_g15366 [Phytophthora fragariae]|nr:hypothetical protein PF003_g15366 [Phytophthora fragariae]